MYRGAMTFTIWERAEARARLRLPQAAARADRQGRARRRPPDRLDVHPVRSRTRPRVEWPGYSRFAAFDGSRSLGRPTTAVGSPRTSEVAEPLERRSRDPLQLRDDGRILSRQRPSVGGGSTSPASSAGSPSSSRNVEQARDHRLRGWRTGPRSGSAGSARRAPPRRTARPRGSPRVQSAIDPAGESSSASGPRNRLTVLARLVLVLREGHVATVAHDVHEPHPGQHLRRRTAAGRCCVAPSSPTARRCRAQRGASSTRAQVGAHPDPRARRIVRGREVAVEPSTLR